MRADTTPTSSSNGTREALIAAGIRCFAANGYEGSRLIDIASDADVTTGAFYGHFGSKAVFFDVAFSRYAEALEAALNAAGSLEEQIAKHLEVSYEYRGVLRAGSELLQRSPEYTETRRRLRDACAALVAWHLREPLTLADAQIASRFLVDTLDQYALMVAAGWMRAPKPADVARTLVSMVEHGVYKS